MSVRNRNWAMLLGAVLALFGAAWLFGALHKDTTPREILYASSAVPAAQLRQCLTTRLSGSGGAQADVHDSGKARRVDLRTPGGRAMTGGEAAALKACLGGAV